MMFGGTSGALSQSPDSYCAVAKTNSVMTTSPRVAPLRIDALDRVRRPAMRRARTSASVASCPARSASMAGVASARGERRRVVERVDAQREQRVDGGRRIRARASSTLASKRSARRSDELSSAARGTPRGRRAHCRLAREPHLVDVDDHHRRPCRADTAARRCARAESRRARGAWAEARCRARRPRARGSRPTSRCTPRAAACSRRRRASRRPRSRSRPRSACVAAFAAASSCSGVDLRGRVVAPRVLGPVRAAEPREDDLADVLPQSRLVAADAPATPSRHRARGSFGALAPGASRRA